MAEDRNLLQRYLRYSTMGLELGLSVVFGVFIGWGLDTWLGTEPWLLLLCTLLGMAAGFIGVYRHLREIIAEETRRARDYKP
jgi:ATP synthase protein I